MVCGAYIGFGLLIISYLLSYNAAKFLIHTSELCSFPCTSYYELGYALMGPVSIYFTSIGIFLQTLGFAVVYVVVAAETFEGLIRQFVYNKYD